MFRNFKLQILNFKKNPQPTTHNSQPFCGFSLIELLIAVSLMGIIGIITTQIFILGIRSQVKSELMKEVKQNGDYASTVIERMLRSAVDIRGSQCNTNTKTLYFTDPGGDEIHFDCSDGTKISSVSGLSDLAITSNKVIVPICNFRIVCPTPPLSPKYVFVSFTVTQATGLIPTPGALITPIAGETVQIPYQTTVSLRTY